MTGSESVGSDQPGDDRGDSGHLDAEQTKRFARAFDETARDFDRLGQYLWRPIGAATVARTCPTEGERVLDACCGTGASALPAAHRVGSRGEVDAVDLSGELIARLEEGARDLPQLRPHSADVLSWDRDDYDVVQCALGVFFFPDMTAGTDHLVSRARIGGRVGATIWRRGAVETAARHLRRALERVTGVENSEERPEHLIDRIGEAGAFGDWLSERGLGDVKVTEHELEVSMAPETAWLVVTGSGFVAALAGLDDEQVARVREAYLRSLAEAGVDRLDATTLVGVGTRLVV